MKEDRAYIEYILYCINLIETYYQGRKEEFLNN
jgi:hypothetical protein